MKSRSLEPLVVLLAVLFVGLASLTFPFARDQGEYAYIAAATLEGRVPYRDLFNVKPPLTHVVHMAAIQTFGRSMMAIRLLDLVWQGATAFVILLIARSIFARPGVGTLSSIIYAFLYYSNDYWNTAQTDGFLNLPVSLAVLAFCAAQAKRDAWRFLACGAAIGVAILFKYPIGVLLPLLSLLVIMQAGWRGVLHVLQLGIGCCVPLAACGLMLIAQGGLEDFLFIQFTYLPKYMQLGSDFPMTFRGFLSFLFGAVVGCAFLAAAAGLVCVARAKLVRQSWPVVLWGLAAIVHLVSQNKYYVYHSFPLLAPASIFTAYLVVVLCDRFVASRSLWHGLALGCVFAMFMWYWGWGMGWYRHHDLLRIVMGHGSLEDVYEGYPKGRDYSVKAELGVARYVQQHTAPDDAIFIWGFEPGVYFLAQRNCATRFIYNFPLMGDFALSRLREEFIVSLERAMPLYILIVRDDAIPWVTGIPDDSQKAFVRFTRFHDLVMTRYTFETEIENFSLYRRRS